MLQDENKIKMNFQRYSWIILGTKKKIIITIFCAEGGLSVNCEKNETIKCYNKRHSTSNMDNKIGMVREKKSLYKRVLLW